MTGAGEPIGYVVVDPGTPSEATVPLIDRLFVGRECAGVDDAHRILIVDDLAVSRNHLELRVDPDLARASVVDTSSNGVRVNGIRIERATSVPLHGGDKIQVGTHVLEFRSATVTTVRAEPGQHRATVSTATPMTTVIVVGDLINFSTVSEESDQKILARDVRDLYQRLRELLPGHRGTLVDYVGDAFEASWELEVDPQAAVHALEFALAADRLVSETTAGFELRYADGTPLRMGWAVTMGPVTMQLMPGSVVIMLGDIVNLAFRISGIAGREHRPKIIAAENVRQAAEGMFTFGEPETITVKGRVSEERIYGVSPR